MDQERYPVMLRPTWQGSFSRTIRNEKNEPVDRLTFEHNVPRNCTGHELAALLSDVGKSLCIARFDEKGRPKPDWDKTQRLIDGESMEEVFADAPPIVGAFGDENAIPIEESLIPKKHHSALKKNQLPTLESIAIYLEEHETLAGLKGINEKAHEEIVEALQVHAEPATDEVGEPAPTE